MEKTCVIEEVFFQLLQMASGTREGLDALLQPQQWAELFAIAKKQSVMAFVYQAVKDLPDEQKPPLREKLQFALIAEKIAEHNALMDVHAAEVSGAFRSLGFANCVLKGQSVAMLYPVPESRQSGDIDLWVEGGRRRILEALKGVMEFREVCYHHADVKFFDDRTELEVHFTPSWMNSPFLNRRLQRFFEANACTQFANVDESKAFARPTPAFDCVFSLVHIYRHLLFEGIGFRQLTDYFFILKHTTEEERRKAFEVLCSLGMRSFTAAVMYVSAKVFLLERKYFLTEPDPVYGEFLLDEILKSGNFGKYDKRNAHKRGESAFSRFVRRSRRLFRYFHLAPSEVLWAPFFKIWQFIWRKINKFD